MTPRTALFSPISAHERHSGIDSNSDRHPPGITTPDFDCWVEKRDRSWSHPFPDCRAKADLFEARCARAQDLLYGDLADDPGALSVYEKHRTVERLLAQYHQQMVAPWCVDHRPDLVERIKTNALKMYCCRQGGVFGVVNDKLVMAWDSKCSLAKLCPDEARAESLRLYDRYADLVAAHARRGRVYKAWLTLPNYPPGRLREGMRHIYKRFRDRLVRSQKIGIDGALVILEAPLSAHGDWNVHLNVILLTPGWLSYKQLREVWGANVEVRQHSRFDDAGMHALFNEMVKYAVRTVPEKSLDERHSSDAPPLIYWEPRDYVEWFEAHHPFRRTRAYGTLYGAPRPDRPVPVPPVWLGRIDYDGARYKTTMRRHNLGHLAGELLQAPKGAYLDLIRGDKSTKKRAPFGVRGPP